MHSPKQFRRLLLEAALSNPVILWPARIIGGVLVVVGFPLVVSLILAVA